MAEQPSWQTSTLSQLAIVSVGMYLLGALWLLWKGTPAEQALAMLNPLKWSAEIFGASYLATRKPTNGGPPPTGGANA